MSQREEQVSRLLEIGEEVQSFYEQYPYPRPIDDLEKYRRRWQDRQRRRADFHLFWPAKPYRENHSILVAGCGTSQAAKHAMRWPEAQVIGIDFSETSVRCTEELKRKYGLKNLQIRQLPVEEAGGLGMSFDLVVCTGVLHHLADPRAGLRALRGVLKPDGAMHLMVYAPYGRAGIYMLQEFCRRLGIHASEDAIRDLILALRALPPGHPLEAMLRGAREERLEAELTDSLLHPQDRAYSVPQFFEFLEQEDLLFGRWIKQAPYSPRCGVLGRLPQEPRIGKLPMAEQFTAVELFRGTMVRHSAVVYRDDNPTPQQISFHGDSWLQFVSIRMPDTIVVQERLPPGAAAVLINPTHTYHDLFMPIDSTRKRVFEAIDGKQSIGELVNSFALAGNRSTILDLAHSFFEQLWWYDQVVFDASSVR
jgi:SAM-dependent methyltransferase